MKAKVDTIKTEVVIEIERTPYPEKLANNKYGGTRIEISGIEFLSRDIEEDILVSSQDFAKEIRETKGKVGKL